jgi:RHS repeat-associated protein
VITSNGTLAAHYEYAPFGAVTAQSGASSAVNPWRFSSEYEDDLLALVYYNYRHYDSRYGRWLTRDILEEHDSVNIYIFLSNNAVEDTDQLGMFKGADCCICAAALIGKFGGVFAGCAYGCYESQSEHYPFNKCLSDCVDKMLSLEEIIQQFKDNPAEWIGASACIICGVKAIKNICKPCSTAEKDAMQASVNLLCKQSGKLSCNRGQTLQELIASRNKMIACQAARVAINTKCFHGGNRDHRTAVNNLTKGIAKCTLLIKAKGGR